MGHEHTRTARRRAHLLLAALASRPCVDQVADRQLAQEALALARQTGEPLLVAESLQACNRHLTALMQPATAWAEVREAARIFRANGLLAREAACHVVAARALYDLGQERQAAAMAHAALQEPALPAADRVAAYVLLFNAHGRMGRLEEAYAFLNEQALPLARALGPGQLLALVLQHKGWLFARLANSRQNAALPLPAHRELSHQGSVHSALDQALALLDEASQCLPPGLGWQAVEVDRQYVLGLRRVGDEAAQAPGRLADLAQSVEAVDPPLAAWTHFTRALLLQDAGRFDEALAALPPGLALAQAHELPGLTRDLMYMRSLICEQRGDLAGAFAALKEHSRLCLSQADGAPSVRYAGPGDTLQGTAGPYPALPPNRLRELEPPHLKRALRWIDQRVGQPMTVAEVVQACGVSRRTLDAAFQAARGTTIAGHVRRRQIEHASEQLLHTDRPVREIAQAIGYSSPAMFAREFRDRLGLTPTQWRGMSRHGLQPPAGA